MRKYIIDTDPGVDDAIALARAIKDHLAGEIEIVMFISSAGNLPIEETTRNLINIIDYYGKGELNDIPIVKGMEHPMSSNITLTTNVHGTSGLPCQAINKPYDPSRVTGNPAQMIDRYYKEDVTYLLLGRATNLATYLLAYPKTQLHEVVAMAGQGSAEGNVSAHGEFNVASDPMAFAIMLEHSTRTFLVGLDMTQTHNQINNQDIDQLPESPIREMLQSYGDRGETQTPVHDLITYLWSRSGRNGVTPRLMKVYTAATGDYVPGDMTYTAPFGVVPRFEDYTYQITAHSLYPTLRGLDY